MTRDILLDVMNAVAKPGLAKDPRKGTPHQGSEALMPSNNRVARVLMPLHKSLLV